MIQFIRDLALLPSIWRRAVRAERYRRWSATPEGQEQERREVMAVLDDLRQGRALRQSDAEADGASA